MWKKRWFEHAFSAAVFLFFALLALGSGSSPDVVENAVSGDPALVSGIPKEQQCQIFIDSRSTLKIYDGKTVAWRGKIMIPPGEHTLGYDSYSVVMSYMSGKTSIVKNLELQYNFLPGTIYNVSSDLESGKNVAVVRFEGVTEWALPGPGESLVIIENKGPKGEPVCLDGKRMFYLNNASEPDPDFVSVGRFIITNGIHKIRRGQDWEEEIPETEIYADSKQLTYTLDSSAAEIFKKTGEKNLDQIAEKPFFPAAGKILAGTWQGSTQDKDFEFEFESDGTGTYQTRTGTYSATYDDLKIRVKISEKIPALNLSLSYLLDGNGEKFILKDFNGKGGDVEFAKIID